MKWRLSSALAVTCVALVGCASDASGNVCSSTVSVSAYIVNLSLGLDNRAEDQYSQFRLDSLAALDIVDAVAAGTSGAGEAEIAAATALQGPLSTFVEEMDAVTWDVTRAVERTSTVAAWRALTSEEQLAHANLMEAWVIDKCGLPTAVEPNQDAPAQLPFPSVPGPTATDPPRGPINEKSEADALGEMVASVFGITVDANQARCLGENLVGVVDQTSASTDVSGYTSQFQSAFDACEIRFTVPRG